MNHLERCNLQVLSQAERRAGKDRVRHHLGQTAAEIVYRRADSGKPFMGLTTWKNSPKGKVLKSDVTVAKNYLNHEESPS